MQSTKAVSDSITAKVWQIIDALPQRAAILEADARSWVETVVGTYGEFAIWHATRAGGFGGSQIGALVRNHMGQRADHDQSAHDIVSGTLLRKIPDEPNGHMRRGIAMESQHRRWFYEKHLARRDDAGFKILSESNGPRPWMRYSPDDLVTMPAMDPAHVGKMVRKLIDFKAPSNVDPSPSVAFQYVCQLHMGRLVCEHNGVKVEGLLLSQFDWANWQLKDDDVPYLAELDDMITHAGDFYWDFVLRGELPPYVRKPRLEPDAVPADVKEAAGRLARMKAIATALDNQIKKLDPQVKEPLSKLYFGSGRLQLDGIAFGATPVFDDAKVREVVPEEILRAVPLKGSSSKRYDEERLVKRIRDLGEKPADYLLPANLDAEALYQALCDHGFDAEAMVKEQLRGTVDKNLAKDAQAIVEREYSDLINAAAGIPAQVTAEAGAANLETNDREADSEPRYVPRSMAA